MFPDLGLISEDPEPEQHLDSSEETGESQGPTARQLVDSQIQDLTSLIFPESTEIQNTANDVGAAKETPSEDEVWEGSNRDPKPEPRSGNRMQNVLIPQAWTPQDDHDNVEDVVREILEADSMNTLDGEASQIAHFKYFTGPVEQSERVPEGGRSAKDVPSEDKGWECRYRDPKPAPRSGNRRQNFLILQAQTLQHDNDKVGDEYRDTMVQQVDREVDSVKTFDGKASQRARFKLQSGSMVLPSAQAKYNTKDGRAAKDAPSEDESWESRYRDPKPVPRSGNRRKNVSIPQIRNPQDDQDLVRDQQGLRKRNIAPSRAVALERGEAEESLIQNCADWIETFWPFFKILFLLVIIIIFFYNAAS